MRLLVELATGAVFGGLVTIIALSFASLYPETLKTIDDIIVPVVFIVTFSGFFVGSSIYEHFHKIKHN